MKTKLFLSLTILCLVPLQIRQINAATTEELGGQSPLHGELEQHSIDSDAVGLDWQTWRDTALFYANTGELTQAETALQKSFELLKNAQDHSQYESWQANVFDVDAYIQMLRGEDEKALNIWKQTAAVYRESGDTKSLSQAVLNQIQALQNLGYYHQAEKQLKPNYDWLQQQPDSPNKVKAIQTFGEIQQHLGKFDEAIAHLENAQAIAVTQNYSELLPELALSLGNAYQSLGNLEENEGEIFQAASKKQSATAQFKIAEEKFKLAIENYQAIPPSTIFGAQAQINTLALLQSQSEAVKVSAKTTQSQIQDIQQNLETLSPNRPALYARINFVRHLFKESQPDHSLIQEQLTTTYQQAEALGDRRSQSHALGLLGKLYFQEQRFSEAEILTNKAIAILPEAARDLTYQWQWQLGQIYRQQNNRPQAIAAYENAIKNLQAIRSDLVAVTKETRFSFQEEIEPVYRQLADLLLHEQATQSELSAARDVIEQLQQAELDNFFRDACLDAVPVKIDQIDPQAAIFYTIILGDRLEVITAVPNQKLSRHRFPIDQSDLENLIKNALTQLTTAPRFQGSQNIDSTSLQTLYTELIQPFHKALEQQGIETLVFVADGALQRIPLGSLYDGEQYLVEQYNVAIAPSLQLVDASPFDVKNKQTQVLSAGISEAIDVFDQSGAVIRSFDSLPGVTRELAQIQQETNSTILSNEAFTKSQFSADIEALPYKVVHIATHGEFSSRLEDTFILTWGKADNEETWGNALNINELETLLRGDRKQLRPIELLVLSACTTAQGDSRAALGLAGMAVRSGARSTIASLWSVDDEATTELMTNFYRYLAQENLTKASAIRQAQRDLIADDQFSHPYYWSAFTLVGNWL